jgi:hypothetical protein
MSNISWYSSNKTGEIKGIGLTLGLFSTIFSFLFFGRDHGTYQVLLFSGVLVSLIFYLTIIFGKATRKTKISWTLLIILAGTIQWFTEPILIKNSFLIYLNGNGNELTAVNNILKDKSHDISILDDDINDKTNQLSQAEQDSLIKLRQDLNVHTIIKTENGIYYGLWGFLGVQHGITYWTKSELPNKDYRPLKGKWYY